MIRRIRQLLGRAEAPRTDQIEITIGTVYEDRAGSLIGATAAQLASAGSPPRAQLLLRDGGDERRIDVAAGEQFELGGGRWLLEDVIERGDASPAPGSSNLHLRITRVD